MLEHVAPNQTRFVAPGLAPDNRGIALGRFVMVLLPSIDRVVGLFRGITEAMSLDEMLTSLKILQVKTPLSSREFLVQLPASSSYGADQIAAVAALVGGLTFTGTNKHFVKYRDSKSPLGHDVDSLYGGQGDYILYGDDFVQAYEGDRELDFSSLALNLSLQRDRGDVLREEDEALIRAPTGLWRSVLVYLHRNAIRCSAAACSMKRVGGVERFYLIRCRDLPPRMVTLFLQTPGIELMRLKLDRAAVQLGYRHPFELTSCASIFAEGSFFLMSGDRDRIDVVDGQLTFVEAAALVKLGENSQGLQTAEVSAAEPSKVSVMLRLVPVSGGVPRVIGTRLPIEQGPWLKKLVYLLPPAILAAYRICVTERHIYMINEEGVDFIPLGEMYYSVAPGVLAPVGFQLIPRVDPDVLLHHLGATADKLFFFCRDSDAPVQLSRDKLEPLARMSLARLSVSRPTPRSFAAPEPGDVELVNEPVGVFPLWGFRNTRGNGDNGDSG